MWNFFVIYFFGALPLAIMSFVQNLEPHEGHPIKNVVLSTLCAISWPFHMLKGIVEPNS